MNHRLGKKTHQQQEKAAFFSITLTFKVSKRRNISEFRSDMTPAFFHFLIVPDATFRMTEQSGPHWFSWGSKWAVVQMTQPMAHTASLFLQRGKRQRHSKWPRRLVVTSGTGIVHRYQLGPLNRKTTHQNSPLHLCLEVSLNEASKRLQVVHVWCDDECWMWDFLYTYSFKIKSKFEQPPSWHIWPLNRVIAPLPFFPEAQKTMRASNTAETWIKLLIPWTRKTAKTC